MTPRIPPRSLDECDEDTVKLIEGTLRSPDGEPLNIFRTLAHNPPVLRRFMAMGYELLLNGTLPPRERELLILRTGWNCRSAYEWGQHVTIGLASGLSQEEVDRVVLGPDAEGWSAGDAALLRAADELHEQSTVSDRTWDALAARYEPRTLIEAVLLVGNYHMVAFFLNATGVEREAGVVGLPG